MTIDFDRLSSEADKRQAQSCEVQDCHRPRAPRNNRCKYHADLYKKYGSAYGPGLLVRDVLKNYRRAAEELLALLADGDEKRRAMLTWADKQVALLADWAAVNLGTDGKAGYRYRREAAEFIQRLSLRDNAEMRRAILMRLLMVEMAVTARMPAWREPGSEHINRARLVFSGLSSDHKAPTHKRTLLVLSEELLANEDWKLNFWAWQVVDRAERERQQKASTARAVFEAFAKDEESDASAIREE